MTWGSTLSVVIPLTLFAYALFLIFRMIKDRKKGKCLGGCASCPLRDSCETVEKTGKPPQKENDPHE